MRAHRIVITCLAALTLIAPACGDPYTGDAPITPDAATGDAPIAVSDAMPDISSADADADAGALCGWIPIADSFETTNVGGGWTRNTVGMGLSLAIGAAPTARGTSLALEMLPNDTGAVRHDRIRQAIQLPAGSAVPSCLRLSLAMFVESLSGPAVGIASLNLANDTAVTLWLDGNQLELASQTADGNTYNVVLRLPFSHGAWHTIAVQLVGGAPTMSVDGASGATAAWPIVLGAPSSFDIGVNFGRAATSSRYWIDDVSVR